MSIDYETRTIEAEITPEMVEELNRKIEELTPHQYREYVKAVLWLSRPHIKRVEGQ